MNCRARNCRQAPEERKGDLALCSPTPLPLSLCRVSVNLHFLRPLSSKANLPAVLIHTRLFNPSIRPPRPFIRSPFPQVFQCLSPGKTRKRTQTAKKEFNSTLYVFTAAHNGAFFTRGRLDAFAVKCKFTNAVIMVLLHLVKSIGVERYPQTEMLLKDLSVFTLSNVPC